MKLQLGTLLRALFFTALIIPTTYRLIGQAPCGTSYYDTGGSAGNYAINQNYSTTYTAPAGNVLRITFNSFNTESGYDFFSLYNGANTAAPLVNSYSGTTLPPTYTSTGQSLTIKFVSDATVVAAGWQITFTCIPACSNTTAGGIIVGDQTICGSYDPTNITSSAAASGGSGTLSYQWESSINNSTWADVSGATLATYDPPAITQTTYYRRKSKNSGCTPWGATSNTITKTVSNHLISLTNPVISSCINHPLQDVATVSITASWTSAPAGAKLKLTYNNKTEFIDVAGGSVSPQTVVFNVPAVSSSGNTIVGSWDTGSTCSNTSSPFTIPGPCSSDNITCNILYLCGSDKPYDGEPFDKGLMDYFDLISTGTIAAALTKPDATGYGLYNIASPSTLLSINLDNYRLIVLSGTTEGDLAPDLITALNTYKGGIFNMNYSAQDELKYTLANESYSYQSQAYTDNTSAIEFLNYDNPGSLYNYVVTGGDYKTTASAALWYNANNQSARVNGIYYKYASHSNPELSSTHGPRVYFGLHMNGLYANASNGGALPAPISSYFAPTKHLTLQGKAYLDQAILDAAACNTEVCTNGTDDDGDGLQDCLDPDCSAISNGEFDNGNASWSLFVQSGNASTWSVDNTSQLVGRNSAKVITTTATGTDWHVQLAQEGESIVAGKKYRLMFRAKASASRNASVSMQLAMSPYTSYFFSNFALVTSYQQYAYVFTASATVSNNINLLFNLATTTGTVWIDDVELTEACNEICTNGFDDDGDGLVDALDTDCNSCAFIGQNLITNGEFDAGDSGFTSDYTSTPIANMCGNFGIYSISNRIAKVGAPEGCNIPIWSVADRANTGGNFMLIDPSAATGVNDRIWAQTLTVCPNTDYVFSLWTKNMYYSEANWYSGVDPNFQFKINGVTLPNANFIMPRQPRADSLTWVKVQGTWNSGSATSAILNVVNKIPGALGNDLALDGLFFGLCGKTVAITAGTTNFCVGSSTTISATAQTTTSGWLFYEWLKDGTVVASGPTATSFVATMAGTYKLRTYYTTANNTGCPAESNNIVITTMAKPSIGSPSPLTLCIGATASITPTTGGTWSSSSTSIATITNAGVITSIAAGTATFTFTQTSSGCPSDASTAITVNAKPTVSITGGSTICAGSTTTLSPTSGGTWTSSNTAVATVSNAGLVTGVSAGTSTFTFTNSTTLCPSNATSAVTVAARPTTNITSSNTSLCIGGTTTASPTTLGTWTSSNTAVATINNTGLITAVSAGSATFTYTLTSSGCSSMATAPFTVNVKPSVSITGGSTICIGGTTTLSPTTGGTWTSSNTAVATVTNAGVVTGVSSGTATFSFTNSTTLCPSDITSVVTVNSNPTISGTTPSTRCGIGTLTLGATASVGVINWYAAISGGASLGTGTSFTTPSLSATTTYYVDATNGSCTTSSRTAVVATIIFPITIVSQVNSSSDDGEEDLSNGVIDLVSSDLELSVDGAKNQIVGMRFTNINIPKNAIITNAYIEFETDVAWNTATALNIIGENVDDAITFTTVASNLSNRSKTVSAVTWNPVVAWNVVDQKQNSPDIKTIVQQIVNRSGWVSGNDMALFITGTGTREAESFDGENPAAPKLYITYNPCTIIEVCNNGIDDDGDEFIDCADSDCPVPSIISTTPASRCGTGTVTLGASASTGTINWYASLTGGSSLGTGTSFTTPSISATTTYYVDATSGTCITASRTAVIATVNSTTPTITGTTPAERCGSGTVTLGATSSGGTINWYAAMTGGSSLGTGISFITPTLNLTTTYYVDATNSGCTTPNRTAIVATIKATPIANAGQDITNCNNAYFSLDANTLLSGESGEWTIVNGVAMINDIYQPKINATLSGTVVLRWTLSNNASCSSFDEVTLINNTACATGCVGAINTNGDLEDEGAVSSFNLSLNGTPTSTMDDLNTIPGWAQRYGSTAVVPVNFLGAFLVKNSNNTSQPHSGDNMIYQNGSYCFSSFLAAKGISCGKKYKASAWVAAYTYNAAQINSTFHFEVAMSGGTQPNFNLIQTMTAPASSSWNNINWNRYEIEFEVPNNGYNSFDFYFTSLPGSGILIDDVCITEINKGAYSNAGDDIYQCGANSFVLNANTPSSGYAGSWISKEGNATFSSLTNPNATATINSGNVSTLLWAVGNGVCKDTSDVIISKLNYKQNKVTGDTICVGEAATVKSNYCIGNISWNNGSTSSTITVTPATTTSYIATCTQYKGPELIKNPSFELSPNLVNWSSSPQALLVTNAQDVLDGLKAIKLNSLTTGEYITQKVNIEEGKMYQLSFWAKTLNTNSPSEVYYQFLDNNDNRIGAEQSVLVTSTTYQKHTKIFIAPPNTSGINIGAWAKEKNVSFYDNISLTEYSNCSSSDTATVLVYNTPIQLSTPLISSCIPNTFTSQISVDVTVSWTNTIAGDKIKVSGGSQVKYIDVATNTSPVTIRLYVPADGSTNNEIKASWSSLNGQGCTEKVYYNSPSPCTSNKINCNILYLFSDYNEADGEPYDKGMTAFLSSITTGTVTNAFTKTGTGMRLYDSNNRNTLLNLNLSDYSLIVVSPSAEGRTSTTLQALLRDFSGSVINMSFDLQTILGYTSATNDYAGINEAFLSSGAKVNPYDYQNLNPTNPTAYVTGSNIKASGIPVLWFEQASVGTKNKAMMYTFPAHSISGITSNHGTRAHVGFSIDGFYSNSINGGSIPAPISAYFIPTKHLDYEVNKLFEQLIFNSSKCAIEICNNNIDDDGDGLIDCFDPDCGQVLNREFDVNLNSWTLLNTAPAVSTLILDGTTKLSGKNAAKINITTATTILENIKFSQQGLSVTVGKSYKITFRARSSTSRTISSSILDTGNPTTIYNTSNHSLINTSVVASNTFSYIFTPSITNSNVSIVFNIGTAVGDIFIDDVRFEEVCCPAAIISTASNSRCGAGSITLGATSSTGTINWYANATGGTSLGTGNFFTPSISATTTYYVDATNGSCTSSTRTAVLATINELPTTNISSSNISLCIGGTTTASPTILGTWASSNTGVATITSAGLITAVSAGTSTFTYTLTSSGCSSLATAPFTVNVKPSVSITGGSTICAGSTTTLSPSTGGTWTSSNTAVATVTNAGVVTGVSGGTATFTFTNSTTLCPSDATSTVTVTARPTTNITSSNTSLCIGGTTTASPTTLGTWTSSNSGVATITTAGLITAVSAGSATFTYTLTSSGCSSMTTAPFTVNIKPSVSITGAATICVGSATTLSPTTGGTWTSSNTAVATVTNAGVVTGVSSGTATFSFANSTTLCPSDATSTVTVTARPTTNITSSNTSLCIGGTTTASPTTLGTWTSSNSGVATINNVGLITAVSAGSATFTYTLTSSGCSSLATAPFTVSVKPSVSITGASTICIGGTTNLSPATGGTWTSSNTIVATVTNAGVVTGVSSGQASFTFTKTSTGCASLSTSNVTISPDIEVSTCISQGQLANNITEPNRNLNANRFTHPEVEGCVYNLEVKYGETFNIRDYFHIKDNSIQNQIDWTQVFFTYTDVGANSPTTPPNWHLSDFNNGLPVTVTSADAASGTGNSGNGQYRIYIYRQGNSSYDDHMEIRVQSSTSNINTEKCDVWFKTQIFKDNNKNDVFDSGIDTPHSGVNVTLNTPSGIKNLTTNSGGMILTNTQPGVVTVNPNSSQLPSGTVIKPDLTIPTIHNTSSSSIVTSNIKTAMNTDIDLSLLTTVSNATPSPGTSITIYVAVTNAGPSQATGVNVKDFFTPGVFTNINTISNSGSTTSGEVIWNNLTLNVGQTITLSFIATIPPSGVSNSRNFAQVTAAVQNDTDSTPNNYDSELSLEDDESIASISTSCAADTICKDGFLIIKTTAVGLGLSYQWQESSNGSSGWQNVLNANSINFAVPSSVIGTKYYRVVISSSISGCGSYTSSNTRITVIEQPTLINVSNEYTACLGTSTNLTSTKNSGAGLVSYQWFYNNGTIIAPNWIIVQNGLPIGSIYSGNSSLQLSVSGISNTGTYQYRLEMTIVSTGCNNTTSPTINLIITNIPSVTTVVPGERCGSGEVPLGATASAGIINWYATATGGSSLGTGTSFTTPSISATTTYYVDVTSNSCVSALRSSVLATINAKPNVSITGSSTICIGSTTALSPTTGGTWSSSNLAVATVTNAGVVTGVSAGTATFTFTNSTTLCPSDATSAVTVTARPTTNITSSNTSLCIGGTTTASPTTLGTWTSSNTAVATITNAGLITAVSSGTATFTYILTSSGCSSLATAPFTVNVKPSVSITGAATICVGSTTTLSPTTGGTWASSNTAVATVTNAGVVTGVSAGTATFSFTNSTSLCPSDATSTVTVNGLTTITNNGSAKICIGGSTTLSPSSGGTWTSSNTSVATVSAGGVVFGIGAGNVNLTFINSAGCQSSSPINIQVGQPFSTSIDYDGSVCLTNNKTLEAIASAGTAPFVYSWTGPSSYTASTKIINITANGNYYLTISDSYGCSSTTSGFVYSSFEPLIVSLQSQVCEGQSITIDANGASNTGYLWSANAGDATTASVTVSPVFPSSTYVVTITNNLGCTASATAVINVIAKPAITITGPSPICQGSTSELAPSTGGTWVSSNNTIATINNAGVVTGISAGTAFFTFTNSTTNCISDPSIPIVINPKSVLNLTGPSPICIGDNTSFSPTSGGTWSSNNPAIASIDNTGTVVALSEGTATFKFTNAQNCVSDNTTTITVNKKEAASISGPTSICVGSTALLSSTRSGGIWSSNDAAILTISSLGLITGIGTGAVIIKYTHYSGACLNEATYNVSVNAKPVATLDGSQTICEGSTTQLSPTIGGTWSSSDVSKATVTNNGLVTAITAGSATFIFTQTSTGCVSNPSQAVTINAKPIISLNGSANLCIGANTILESTSSGTWTSNNNAVAIVSNNGIVTAIGGGTAVFNYTFAATGCSNSSSPINVASLITGSIDFNGSICLTNNSILSANFSGGVSPYIYNWAGPSSFSSSAQNVAINTNGNYFVTITDAYGCNVSRSGFVYEQFQPIFIGLQSQICEGQSVNLSVNGNNVSSYLWSSNAGNSTLANVVVYPSVPSSSYTVTVTNAIGCTASMTANINVTAKPIISISGPTNICVGSATNMLPASGGIWVSNNPTIANINASGLITALSNGTATFTYTNLTTNCVSNESLPVTVNPKPVVSIIGSNIICIGFTSTLSPNTGGTWSSSNNTVASVTNGGLVSALTDGLVNFIYTSTLTGCASESTLPITINPKPTVLINGPNNICIGFTTNVSPSYGGTWASSDPTIATIDNNGLITGISNGTATFVYTEASGCNSNPTALITIKAKPIISIDGSNSICVGGNTNMLPSSGGIWVSSNPTVATISNTGLVNGISAGTSKFTFTNSTTGCTSNESLPINVISNPTISLSGPSVICVGTTTNFTSSTSGTWSSNNPSVATINNVGIVTAIAQGLSTFKFTNSLGCQSANSVNITVNPRPSTILQGDTDICVGGNTQFYPQSGGTWSSNSPGIAVINNNGLVLGISQGSTTFKFVDNLTTCTSSNTVPINVLDPLNIGFTGPTTLCVGNSTNLFPSFGGTWISNNSNIAAVSSNGEITAIAPGIVSFTFTNSISGCQAITTTSLTVNPKPTISVTGTTSLCIGLTSSVSPTSGGVWVSNNPAVATINNNGQITAISAGNVNFRFTDNSTGCVSSVSPNFSVNSKPTVNIVGSSSICIGITTSIFPSSGGTWISNNPTIATTTNFGVVVGLTSGTATFKFIESTTGCESDNTLPITVNPKPVVSILGPNSICIGGTTNFLPSSGGSWTSSNIGIASISSNGLVSGVAQGVTSFLFTSSLGCQSEATDFITVNGRPSISIAGSSAICVGSSTTMSPSTGGTWTSSNTSIATITNGGIVTGLSAGTATFVFTNSSTGCVSLGSSPITINAKPIATLNGPSAICISSTTQLLPSSNGVWTSNNTAIATINNSGQVTGVDAGTANFIYTNTQTGCTTDGSISITVNARPIVALAGSPTICIGTTTTFTSTGQGTWSSKNPTIASITNSGLVTGLSNGTAKFTFTNTSTGCVSLQSSSITVNPKPPVFLIGPAEICVGTTTTLSPNTGGTWVSSNSVVATVTNAGVVSGVSVGSASFLFTETASGCVSNASSVINVVNPRAVSIAGLAEICIDQHSFLLPTTGGTWSSTNTAIATVNNLGEIKAKAPGKVSFQFTDATTGCISSLPEEALNVVSCIDPDFNVTLTNVNVFGNVKTNDDVPITNSTFTNRQNEGSQRNGSVAGAEYSTQPSILSKPSGSAATLQMNSDGSYLFNANTPGQYVYNVGLCFPASGCTFSNLTLTVIDDKDINKKMVANTDIVSTYRDSSIFVNTMYNDKCINALTCGLLDQQMNIMNQPGHGLMAGKSNGWSQYVPSSLFVGMDSVNYRICEWLNTNNCKYAMQLITVKHPSATNSTVGADDFFSIYQDTLIVGNLLLNDSDPEKDQLSITAQGSASSPIQLSQGQYFIASNGSFTFIPTPGFYGPVDIIYTLCDNNVDQFCTNATAHILVIKDMTLRIKAYLEGSLIETSEYSSTGKPLMRDGLRQNIFDGKNLIPIHNPYKIPTNLIDITSKFSTVLFGEQSKFDEIQDSAAVFSVTGENAIVDWVFVEIRDKSDVYHKLSCRAALIQRDGDVVDLDGVSNVKFPRLNADSFYIVIRHRNHLGAMSLLVSQSDVVDFTKISTPIFDFGTTLPNGINYTDLATNNNVVGGYRALWGGDFDADGKLKFTNPNDDQNILFFDVFSSPENTSGNANYNFAIGYYQGDFNMNGKSKYDNPNDDKNLLFSQLLLYPLNTQYLSNFNFFIEQVPKN